jgi:predicted RNase H-like HicB family nuclease
MTRRYPVLLEWEPEGPGYAVSVPASPGCFTQGTTVPEALERAREAISGHIAALRETGQPVPDKNVPVLLTALDVDETSLAGD